jgi:hypothetical protein
VFLVLQLKCDNVGVQGQAAKADGLCGRICWPRMASAGFFILKDRETSQNFTTSATRGGGFRSDEFGTPRSVGRRVRSRSPATSKENTPSFSRGSVWDKLRRSVLPSWYPRVPLQDITWVMRVIMLLFLQPFDTLRNKIGLFVFKCDLNWDSFPF